MQPLGAVVGSAAGGRGEAQRQRGGQGEEGASHGAHDIGGPEVPRTREYARAHGVATSMRCSTRATSATSRAATMDEVRAMRAECQEVETGLSLLRRVVQGRLDIVGLELQRRAEGGDPEDLPDLIARLPEVLSDRTRAPGVGRLPQIMAPGELPAELEAELDAIVGDGHLADLPLGRRRHAAARWPTS